MFLPLFLLFTEKRHTGSSQAGILLEKRLTEIKYPDHTIITYRGMDILAHIVLRTMISSWMIVVVNMVVYVSNPQKLSYLKLMDFFTGSYSIVL
jgi:hypothetical protein